MSQERGGWPLPSHEPLGNSSSLLLKTCRSAASCWFVTGILITLFLHSSKVNSHFPIFFYLSSGGFIFFHLVSVLGVSVFGAAALHVWTIIGAGIRRKVKVKLLALLFPTFPVFPISVPSHRVITCYYGDWPALLRQQLKCIWYILPCGAELLSPPSVTEL